jgi:hypothetical protein
VVIVKVEKARHRPPEPDYNMDKLKDLDRLATGMGSGTSPWSVR